MTLTIQNLTKSMALLKYKLSYTNSDIYVKLITRLSASNSQVEIIKAIVDCEVEGVEKKEHDGECQDYIWVYKEGSSTSDW